MSEGNQLQLELNAIKLAKEFIYDQFNGYAYPVFPLDERGEVMPASTGCVTWVRCESIEITNANCIGFDDSELWFIVRVEADIEWSGTTLEEFEKSISVVFEVYLEQEETGGLRVCSEWECVE